MIRHVVFFRWKPSFTPEIRDQWIAGLEAMIGKIPGMINLTHGADILKTEKSWDHVIIADFESLDDLETYNTHPLHEAIKPFSLPNVEEIAYVDLEVDDVNPATPRENLP